MISKASNGEMRIDARLAKWAQWAVDKTCEADCSPKKMVLRRMSTEGGLSIVDDRRFDIDEEGAPDLEVLADLQSAAEFLQPLIKSAIDDAEVWDGVSRYQLAMVGASNEDIGKPSPPIRISGNHFEEGGEPANAKGERSMIMRHCEALMRMNTAAFQITNELNMRLYARDLAHQEKQMELARMYEEAESRKHEREMEMRRTQLDDERKEAMMRMALPMIPVVANKLLGKPALTEHENPKVAAINAAFKNLSPEDIERICSVLSPEKVMVLSTLFDEVIKNDEPKDAGNHRNGRGKA